MPSTVRPAYQKVVSRNNNFSAAEEFDRRSNGSGSSSSGSSVEDRLLAGADDRMMDTSDMVVQSHIPATNSSEELMPHGGGSSDSEGGGGGHCAVESGKVPNPTVVIRSSGISRKELFTVFVLCFVNLINYMDRLTIAGVLPDIQKTFDRTNSDSGLLQTVFVISYMICAPAFGYLGDRYSRRWIMILGVALWSGTTLAGSYMQSWGWFMTFRALVGVGEASYSTIAPTIISDLFTHNLRSRMLACFYFAIPVGSGLGYMIGSETAKAFNDWRYALRVTPILGLIAVILIFFCKEPERGENEGSGHMEATSYKEDLKDLCKNRSFMYSTLGFTCVAFVTGGLSWWGPTFMHLGVQLQPGNEDIELSSIAMRFGMVAMLAGLIGVPMGSFIAQRKRATMPNCDPVICAYGALISAPFVYLVLVTASHSSDWSFLFVFLAMLSLNMCWSLVADTLLYVVVPTRRSTAEAFQILISHMFGDAGSPYLVGLLSQSFETGSGVKELPAPSTGVLKFGDSGFQTYAQMAENATTLLLDTTTNTISSIMTTTMATSTPAAAHERLSFQEKQDKFFSLQYALFIMCFVEVVGAAIFFVTSFYVVRDKQKVDLAIQDSQQPHHNEDSTESSSLSM